MHMQAKAFLMLMLTGVQIETYTTRTVLKHFSFQHHPPCTFTPTHVTTSIKKPQNKFQKKHFAKKCKNKSCRDALPSKNTSPKTNETSGSAHRNACTDYPHCTAQCIYRIATIPTSFQPHPPQSVPCPLNCTPNTSLNTQQSTIITINHHTLSPSNNHPYILIHNH